MVKKYSPIHVTNPTSLQHIIWLQPYQSLILNLDPKLYPNINISSTTDYLEKSESENTCLFKQANPSDNWNQYSNCHLGDIWITSSKTTARLVVMLNCTNQAKSGFVTVINPDCSDIRLKPPQILEVVLFDLKFKQQDEWTWSWLPKSGVTIENIGVDFIYPRKWDLCNDRVENNPNNPYSCLQRIQRKTDCCCREHHFWFRLSASTISQLSDDAGIVHIGDLRFRGFNDRFHRKLSQPESELMLSIHVNLQKKYRGDIIRTLALRTHKEYNDIQSGRRSVRSYIKNKIYQPMRPFARDVEFELLDSIGLESNLKPPREIKIDQFDIDLDESFCDQNFRNCGLYRNQNPHWSMNGPDHES